MRKNSVGFFKFLTIQTQIKILLENFSDIDPVNTKFILRFLLIGMMNSLFVCISFLFFAQGRKKEIRQDPVFILGHWRSGTSWLHELLMHDDRFIAPGTLEVLRPLSFRFDRALYTFLKSLHLKVRTSIKRPMDSMVISLDSPQEDEFALLSMGVPSPSRWLFFFDNAGTYLNRQGWNGLPDRTVRRICRKWVWFLSCVQARAPEKQLLLKSPPHSWRVTQIRKVFPNAKFVFIVRRPEDVYVSFRKMLNTYLLNNSLSRREPYVSPEDFTQNYTAMCRKILSEAEAMPDNAFTVLRYEDLKQNPAAEVRRIFRNLGYENFAPAIAKLEQEMADGKFSKPPVPETADVHLSGPEIEAFCRRFGYTAPQMQTKSAE